MMDMLRPKYWGKNSKSDVALRILADLQGYAQLSSVRISVILFFSDCFVAGRLSTLRHLRDDITAANNGTECGLSVTDENFNFEEGDKIESFEMREEKEPVKWKF